MYEQSATNPVQCLSLMKKECLLDIIIGNFSFKIVRNNHIGQLAQTTLDNGDHEFLHRPGYITENNNGDFLVTDSLTSSSVMAIGCRGNHRFASI